jgi:MFS family permease
MSFSVNASPTSAQTQARAFWFVTLLAASVLMITMGARQSLGLFVSPLNTATGLGIVEISFAMAVGQFMWGAIQPIAGAVADRYGPGRVLAAGAFVLSIGYAVTPMMTSSFGLIMSIGILTAAGAGAGSFSVLIGAAAQRLPAERRGMASGIRAICFCAVVATIDRRLRLDGRDVVDGDHRLTLAADGLCTTQTHHTHPFKLPYWRGV